MSSRLWLLVEWVDERNVFPAYGVVNIDTLSYEESELHPGKLIYIRLKHENPRRGQILRISDNKHYVKEHKEIMERQDQQVKNVLQLCMRTIKELKSESMYITPTENVQSHMVNQNAISHIVDANSENSGSDSDLESNHHLNNSTVLNFAKSMPKYPSQLNRQNLINGHHSRLAFKSSNNTRRRSMISSTPLPDKNVQDTPLCFDQGTQTENSCLETPHAKIKEMEVVLRDLYSRFQCLVAQANNINSNSIDLSESEHHDGDTSYIEPNINGSWKEQHHIEDVHTEHDVLTNIEEIGAEEVIETSCIKAEIQSYNSNDTLLRVRRMSAQTTNNIDASPTMVPIGDGNATVPARLLNDIDWNSYTSATRQLLQSVFSRRDLATHSLTGKQSPAFTNKPLKKSLDPKLVEDIIKTVSIRCGVPKNLVRNAVTIKCTDEAKLYRNRQKFRQIIKQDEENVPPSTPSSDESSNIVH